MTSSKKLILCAGITLVIIMGVVPPWKAAMNKVDPMRTDDVMVHTYVYRYGLIFTPPHLSHNRYLRNRPWTIEEKVIHDFHLDMPRLIIQ